MTACDCSTSGSFQIDGDRLFCPSHRLLHAIRCVQVHPIITYDPSIAVPALSICPSHSRSFLAWPSRRLGHSLSLCSCNSCSAPSDGSNHNPFGRSVRLNNLSRVSPSSTLMSASSSRNDGLITCCYRLPDVIASRHLSFFALLHSLNTFPQHLKPSNLIKDLPVHRTLRPIVFLSHFFREF